jgi:colicin import membrane protein
MNKSILWTFVLSLSFLISCASTGEVEYLRSEVKTIQQNYEDLSDKYGQLHDQIEAQHNMISNIHLTAPNTDENKTTEIKKEVSSTQCKAITKKGSQCTRNAIAGTDYCWQHSKSSVKTEKKDSKTNTGVSDNTIQTGPRGGKYYINSHGNKTYIKKGKK